MRAGECCTYPHFDEAEVERHEEQVVGPAADLLSGEQSDQTSTGPVSSQRDRRLRSKDPHWPYVTFEGPRSATSFSVRGYRCWLTSSM